MIDGPSSPGYLISCACGYELRVGDAQAGASVVCPACGASVELPSLSRMRHMPIVAGLVEEGGTVPFRLSALVALVACFALLTIFDNVTGFPWIWPMALVCMFGAMLAAIMPRPVVYGTVLSGLLLIVGALVSCSLAAARDNARRTWCMDNLKNMGLGIQAARQYDPGSQRTLRDRMAEQPHGPNGAVERP
ncbi:MAG TPA: hypothetical protein VHC22_09685 [Pirellulales bacterium]|nr:hypothetical protein [Pirellulales bacterium]